MKEYILLKSFKTNIIAIDRETTVIRYYKNKNYYILHREGDKPALIYSDGSFFYYKNNIFISMTRKK
jgi:hypothetical protein